MKERKPRGDSVIRQRIKRSRKHEKQRAEQIGGRTTVGSGNRDNRFDKGDVRLAGVLREEHKETEARSFSLKLSELQKIEQEALAAGEMPVFRVTFIHNGHQTSYSVLREQDFDALREDAQNDQ